MSSHPKKAGMPEHDPYEILGIDGDATDEMITKAYRKKALKLHPDKNKGKTPFEAERLAEQFHRVKEARAFLLEHEHREARQKYHAKRASQRQRQQADAVRHHSMSDRRKRMREELHRNEDQAKKQQRKDATTGRSKKHNDDDERMEHLQKQGSRMRQKYAQQSAEQAAHNQHAVKEQARQARQQQERLLQDRQVRLKWSRKKMDTSPDEHTLATLLSQFGTVQEVERMGTKGNAAMVTFADPASCRPCVASYRTSDQMRANFVGPRKELEEARMAAAEGDERMPVDTGKNSASNEETLEERKQRQAMERERLAREIIDKEDVTTSASRCVSVQLPAGGSLTSIQKLQQAETDILGALLSSEAFARLKALHV